MKVLEKNEDATTKRKFIKSQVEKRRRERMNCSLERLRSMLLQEPQQQVGANCRVEKAEILEHAVHFLQSISKEGPARADSGDGGQTHCFQDGVSTCLQRAAQFLGPAGKDVWLGSDPSRFAHSDSDSSGGHRRTEGSSFSSPPNTKTILQMLKHKSNHRRQAGGLKGRGFVRPGGAAAERELPRVNRMQNQPPSSVETGQASKQSLAQNCPVTQTLWRPWP